MLRSRKTHAIRSPSVQFTGGLPSISRVTARQLKIPPRFRPALALMCASCEPLSYISCRASTPSTAVDSYAGRFAKWRVALPNRGIGSFEPRNEYHRGTPMSIKFCKRVHRSRWRTAPRKSGRLAPETSWRLHPRRHHQRPLLRPRRPHGRKMPPILESKIGRCAISAPRLTFAP